ncbi:uncharacterized protein LOC107422427 isoform X2 [Ziziphus jujuba]|uniref:ribose-5-phosphate isomerase n=1 Tax=Ziziphus jujuba TaxID=326968 RepID=A0ABM3IQ99_ZIZJJ|nr:uncharacterized protein LOC107422427 isoform X2 [Ziziphus jujuba]
MEDDSDMNIKKEVEVSTRNEGVDDDRVGERSVPGLGDEEVEPPAVGMVFSSEDEVRNYYSKYAQHEGFGVYRRSSRCGDDGKVKYFTLACAKAGKVRGSNGNNRFPWRQSPKTNCKAKINVAVESHTRVYVCHVVLEHNHELSPGKVHRNICKKSGIRRVHKRREGKEQVGSTILELLHPTAGKKLGCENLMSGEGGSCSDQLSNGDCHILFHDVGHSSGENVFPHLSKSPVSGISQNFQEALKSALVKRAVGLVKSGMVIGLGAGRTLSLIVEELGTLIREGKLKGIVVVGTNYQSRSVARQFGVTTVDLNDVHNIDIAFDVVDEVDFNKNMLKGSGATHTVQKVVYSMADMCVILAEHAKVVHRLGSKNPVAVEVLPIAVTPVLRRLVALGGVPEIRSALRKDGPVITDLGNMIVDVGFPNGIQNPAELEKNINVIPGVVDNGVVTGVATAVLVAFRNGGDVSVMNLEKFVEVVLGHRCSSFVL